MFLDKYRQIEGNHIAFTRHQGSQFAKDVAGDFNPIHDADAKRFCVPGDLLFACALEKYGISKSMCFTFSGMVGDGTSLNFPDTDDALIDIVDGNQKKYLSVERKGSNLSSKDTIKALTRRYVEFSGQTFPHILVPLMQEHSMMINPDRPLIIYENMAIELDTLDFQNPALELTSSSMNIVGKRGNALLEFCLTSNGEIIGKGTKRMVLSGLRAFSQSHIQELIDRYTERKNNYIPH